MKRLWQQPTEELCAIFHTDAQTGLSNDEAKSRQQRSGLNKLPEQERSTVLELIAHQFESPIIWVLFIAIIMCIVLQEWIDASAITFLIILNAAIGFIQEYKAEKSLAALRSLLKPVATVLRNSSRIEVDSSELVPGDIVFIEEGDTVPADGRIIYSNQLTMQEAALTGESLPVEKVDTILHEKDLLVGDQKNIAFMGTIALTGKATLIIASTGLATELGRIAHTLKELPEEKTALQRQIEDIGLWLMGVCIALAFGLFIFALIQGISFTNSFLLGISLAVAAIPEGLPTLITVALAIGVKRMVRRSVLMRRLSAVETLGTVTVICTDKTGTLTQNEMMVTSIFVGNELFSVTGSGYTPSGEFLKNERPVEPRENKDLMLALEISTLSNNAQLIKTNKLWSIQGDPTEGSLLVAAQKAGIIKKDLEREFPLIAELPFNSDRKRMSMLRKIDNSYQLFVKGAPETIIDVCDAMMLNGAVVPLTYELKQEINIKVQQLSSDAQRVIAVAYRELNEPYLEETLENNLIFVALMGMIDPPRPEVFTALQTCKRAGIKTIMITGDHRNTAFAIAKQLNIASHPKEVLDGIELDKIDDDALNRIMRQITVFARVTAFDKLRIIRALKKNGEIIAMTGDGVNDAPAIKSADIGIAMGITGTDVTKESADMILLNDNFASIVNAIEEGRGVYDSIVKTVNYLLSSNAAELFVLVLGSTIGFTATTAYITPLYPIQILWVNLISDGLPAVALLFDPLDKATMKRSPRSASTHLISFSSALEIGINALVMAFFTLIAGYYGLSSGPNYVNTIIFTTLILLEFVRVQMIRSHYRIPFFTNKWVALALIGSFILQLLIIYIPYCQKIFNTVPLDLNHWLIMVICATSCWISSLILKQFSNYVIHKNRV